MGEDLVKSLSTELSTELSCEAKNAPDSSAAVPIGVLPETIDMQLDYQPCYDDAVIVLFNQQKEFRKRVSSR